MSAPALLTAGRELSDWLRLGGQPERAGRSLVWLYRWRAFWLERSYKLLRQTDPAAQNSPFPEGEHPR